MQFDIGNHMLARCWTQLQFSL